MHEKFGDFGEGLIISFVMFIKKDWYCAKTCCSFCVLCVEKKVFIILNIFYFTSMSLF